LLKEDDRGQNGGSESEQQVISTNQGRASTARHKKWEANGPILRREDRALNTATGPERHMIGLRRG